MSSFSDYLGNDHRLIDEYFADADAAAACSEWHQCGTAFSTGQQSLLAHIRMEENVLFPAFEAASGMASGPTDVMRAEHQQIQALLADMQQAAADWNNDAFLSLSGDLHQTLGLHNQKEENILYPMADRLLAGKQDDMIAAMQRLSAST
jgi:hemerythrin-like domain-containing protein